MVKSSRDLKEEELLKNWKETRTMAYKYFDKSPG